MNIVDVIIIIMVISSLFRGFEIGLIRQLFSTAGFFSGLFLGAALQEYTVRLANTPSSRTVITITTTLGLAFLFLWLGEMLGSKLKGKLPQKLNLHAFDNYLGSVLSAVTVLIVVWLTASVAAILPAQAIQTEIKRSVIIAQLDASLPAAPNIIASLGHLIDPNGFPQVFTGSEPELPANTTVPGITAEMQRAIDKTKVSTVKLEGLGCGGVVNGSGFIIGPNLVATNAHVIAGVRKPYVKDANGQHSATPVWFDPELDFAIVKTQNLAGSPLVMSNTIIDNGTLAAILGYPGGGPLTAGGATILDDFTARGRDIYGNGVTERDVYSLAGMVNPGNSGGPLISADGTVIGLIFAESTSYENVGYALTTPQLNPIVSQVQAQNRAVSTGNCAE